MANYSSGVTEDVSLEAQFKSFLEFNGPTFQYRQKVSLYLFIFAHAIQVETMLERGENRLVVDLDHLRTFNSVNCHSFISFHIFFSK